MISTVLLLVVTF